MYRYLCLGDKKVVVFLQWLYDTSWWIEVILLPIVFILFRVVASLPLMPSHDYSKPFLVNTARISILARSKWCTWVMWQRWCNRHVYKAWIGITFKNILWVAFETLVRSRNISHQTPTEQGVSDLTENGWIYIYIYIYMCVCVCICNADMHNVTWYIFPYHNKDGNYIHIMI